MPLPADWETGEPFTAAAENLKWAEFEPAPDFTPGSRLHTLPLRRRVADLERHRPVIVAVGGGRWPATSGLPKHRVG